MTRDEFLKAMQDNSRADPYGFNDPVVGTPDFQTEDTRKAEAKAQALPFVQFGQDALDSGVAVRLHPHDPNPLPIAFPQSAAIADQDFLFGSDREVMKTRMEWNDRAGDTPVRWNDPNFELNEELLSSTLKKYNLPSPRYAEKLAEANSMDEMEMFAQAYAKDWEDEQVVMANTTGLAGFFHRAAVNMFDPTYLVAGGVAGKVLQVGASATRTGNAIRAAGAALASDGTLETIRYYRDPKQTTASTVAAVVASMTLSGALGSFSKNGLSKEELQYIDIVGAGSIERPDVNVPVKGDAGSAQARPVPFGPDDYPDVEGAPAQAGFGSVGTPSNFLERSPDPLVRRLASMLSWNPNSKSAGSPAAFEAQKRIYESIGPVMRIVKNARQAYYRARGETSIFGGVNPERTGEFNRMVGRVLRGATTTTDPEILRAVAAVRQGFREQLAYVQEADFVPGRTPSWTPGAAPPVNGPGTPPAGPAAGPDAPRGPDAPEAPEAPEAPDAPVSPPEDPNTPNSVADLSAGLGGVGQAIGRNFVEGWYDTLSGGAKKSSAFKNESRFEETKAAFERGEITDADSLRAYLEKPTAPEAPVAPEPRPQAAPDSPRQLWMNRKAQELANRGLTGEDLDVALYSAIDKELAKTLRGKPEEWAAALPTREEMDAAVAALSTPGKGYFGREAFGGSGTEGVRTSVDTSTANAEPIVEGAGAFVPPGAAKGYLGRKSFGGKGTGVEAPKEVQTIKRFPAKANMEGYYRIVMSDDSTTAVFYEKSGTPPGWYLDEDDIYGPSMPGPSQDGHISGWLGSNRADVERELPNRLKRLQDARAARDAPKEPTAKEKAKALKDEIAAYSKWAETATPEGLRASGKFHFEKGYLLKLKAPVLEKIMDNLGLPKMPEGAALADMRAAITARLQAEPTPTPKAPDAPPPPDVPVEPPARVDPPPPPEVPDAPVSPPAPPPEAPRGPDGPDGPEAPTNDYTGAESFRNVEADESYMPQLPNTKGIETAVTRFGEQGVINRLARLILRSGDNRARFERLAGRVNSRRSVDAIAERVATKYLSTFMKLTDPSQVAKNPFRTMRPGDRDAAREIVRAEFNDGDFFDTDIEEAIDMILDLVAPVSRKAADSDRAKPRITLDFDEELDRDIIDMWEWDSEKLLQGYARNLSGHSALLRAGFQSVAEVDAVIAQVKERGRLDFARKAERAHEVQLLEAFRDHVLGRPGNMDDAGAAFIADQIRRWNYSRAMNNVGFLSMSEILGSLITVGPIRFFKEIPRFNQYLRAARNGDIEAVNELHYLADAWAGHPSQGLLASIGRGMDERTDDLVGDFLSTERTGIADGVDTFTRKMANVTGRFSGMQGITAMLRSVTFNGILDTAHRWAVTNRGLWSEKRMRALGIEPEMWSRIQIELATKPNRTVDGGRQRVDMAAQHWTDTEALNAFINFADRATRRVIQEGEVGTMPLWMRDTLLGKVLTQFLAYPIHAGSKQLGFSMAVGDTRAVAEQLAMTAGGYLGYMSRVFVAGYANYASQEERQKYFDERFSPGAQARGAIYYSPAASLLPNATDSVLGVADQAGLGPGPQFSGTRSTTNSADLVTGNPTYAGIEQGGKALTGLTSGTVASRNDIQAIVKMGPLGNWLPLAALVEYGSQVRPEEDPDDKADNKESRDEFWGPLRIQN